jgi:hypothetical protein
MFIRSGHKDNDNRHFERFFHDDIEWNISVLSVFYVIKKNRERRKNENISAFSVIKIDLKILFYLRISLSS